MKNYNDDDDFLNIVIPSGLGKPETIGSILKNIRENKERTYKKQMNLNDDISVDDIEGFCDYILFYKKVKVSFALKEYLVHIVNDKLNMDNPLEAIVKQNIVRDINYEGYNDFHNVCYDDYDFVYNYLKDHYNAFNYSQSENKTNTKKDTEYRGRQKSKSEEVKDIFMAASAGIGVATGLITLGTLIADKFLKKK